MLTKLEKLKLEHLLYLVVVVVLYDLQNFFDKNYLRRI
jgi:hypothetical protein